MSSPLIPDKNNGITANESARRYLPFPRQLPNGIWTVAEQMCCHDGASSFRCGKEASEALVVSAHERSAS